MENPVYADSLDDFLTTKHQFGFPLKYIQAGLAIWNSGGHCVFVSDYVREILGISPLSSDGLAENIAKLVSLDLIATPKRSSKAGDALNGWNLRRTYITDMGVIYLEIVVRPILHTEDKKLLGYLSVFQNVTNHHEPVIFQEKLYELLRCSNKTSSVQATTRQIYSCIEMLGFREMTAVIYDEKNNKLEAFSRVVRGKDESLSQSWAIDDPRCANNRLVKLIQTYLKTQKAALHIQNEPDNLGALPTKHPYACLPIVYSERLIGYLVLGQSHSQALTPSVVDCAGRTSRFLDELAPVFNWVFVEPRKVEGSRKWSSMKDKLETMNLNQKQIQILEMIVQGETNKGIANVVNLSEQGVKYHVGNLLEIFHTRNRTELRTKLHELLSVA